MLLGGERDASPCRGIVNAVLAQLPYVTCASKALLLSTPRSITHSTVVNTLDITRSALGQQAMNT